MDKEYNNSRGREFLIGVRDQLPILFGVIPFGVIFGALARGAGIPALESHHNLLDLQARQQKIKFINAH